MKLVTMVYKNMKQPKPSSGIIEALSIDCVIFGFADAELYILLVKHSHGMAKGKWALPGGWIKYNESVDDAASRILTAQTAVSNIYLEQLKTFGDVNRFPSTRVITVAYFALVNKISFVLQPGSAVSDVRWFNVHDVPEMAFDHSAIFEYGFRHLKHKVRHEPIGFNLLPKKFTLLQLQELYEAILETKFDKPNFRRKLMKMNLLIRLEEREEEVWHRPSNYYKFDTKVYHRLIEKGFVFEL